MPTDDWERGFAAGWHRAHEILGYRASEVGVRGEPSTRKGDVRKTARRAYESPKPKRKASAYSKRYGAAFRKVASRFKKKNGSWKTNGFKNAQKAAHKLARRK
jgi:hypothetical protein